MTIINSDTAKHSPLPKLRIHEGEDYIKIYGGDVEFYVPRLQTATLIVRACNAFEPMKEALRKAFNFINNINYCDGCDGLSFTHEDLEQIKSTLALAESNEYTKQEGN